MKIQQKKPNKFQVTLVVICLIVIVLNFFAGNQIEEDYFDFKNKKFASSIVHKSYNYNETLDTHTCFVKLNNGDSLLIEHEVFLHVLEGDSVVKTSGSDSVSFICSDTIIHYDQNHERRWRYHKSIIGE